MGEHRLVVDRVEGDLAVVEVDGGAVLDLPLWMLPEGTRESAVVSVTSAGGEDGVLRLTLRLDPEAGRRAREAAAERLERLRSRDPGGDVEL